MAGSDYPHQIGSIPKMIETVGGNADIYAANARRLLKMSVDQCAFSILISYGAYIMTIADLAQIAGRTYPARRRTQNLVGGVSPIQATNFSMGNVTLEPNGGQVPWHNQEQEEIYFIVEGTAKCAWAKSA